MTEVEIVNEANMEWKWRKCIDICEVRALHNLLIQQEDVEGMNSFLQSRPYKMSAVTPTSASLTPKSKSKKSKNQIRMDLHIKKKETSYIFCDVERTGGQFDSEILQISMVSGREGRTFFNRYLKIKGGMDPIASKRSHKMKIHGGNLINGRGEILQTCSIEECVDAMLIYLNEIKTHSESDCCLVTYGDGDVSTICNTLDSLGKYEEFKSIVEYHCDFNRIMRNDSEIVERCNDKTTLADTSDTGILKIITGVSADPNQIHDAQYDSKCLKDIFFKYMKSGEFNSETMSSFRRTQIKPICEEDIRKKFVNARRRRLNNPDSNRHRIFFPLGFP